MAHRLFDRQLYRDRHLRPNQSAQHIMGEQRDHTEHWAFDVIDGLVGFLSNPHAEIPVQQASQD